MKENLDMGGKYSIGDFGKNLIGVDIFSDGFPACSCSPCYLAYTHSLFPHCLKHMPILRCERIYHRLHENTGGGKYSMAFSGYFSMGENG